MKENYISQQKKPKQTRKQTVGVGNIKTKLFIKAQKMNSQNKNIEKKCVVEVEWGSMRVPEGIVTA